MAEKKWERLQIIYIFDSSTMFKVYIQELIMARIFIQTLGIQHPANLEDGTWKTFFVVRETVC